MRLSRLATRTLLTVLCACAFHVTQAAPRGNDDDIWGRPYQELMDAWAETCDLLADGLCAAAEPGGDFDSEARDALAKLSGSSAPRKPRERAGFELDTHLASREQWNLAVGMAHRPR